MIKVSPSYRQEQLDSGEITMVDVYADIVTSCVFRFANIIANVEHSGIAVLTLMTAVFEPVGGILRSGDASPLDTGKNFIKGFDRLFQPARPSQARPSSDRSLAERVYCFVRCGLFHEGFIKPRICLKASAVGIADEDGTIIIDPMKFLHDAEEQFEAFVKELKSDDSLRLKFDNYWRRRDKKHRKELRRYWPTAAVQSRTPTGTTTIAPCADSITLVTGTGWKSVKGHSSEEA
jgi:hypothetical protein